METGKENDPPVDPPETQEKKDDEQAEISRVEDDPFANGPPRPKLYDEYVKKMGQVL